jgi:hypothetical protein
MVAAFLFAGPTFLIRGLLWLWARYLASDTAAVEAMASTRAHNRADPGILAQGRREREQEKPEKTRSGVDNGGWIYSASTSPVAVS